MIEDMEDKGILDKARMEGMNQGVWLSVQELAHDGRWTQAAEELVSVYIQARRECDCRQEREREINPPEYDIEVHVVREKDVF